MVHRLYLIGEINEELFISFTKELAEIENVAKKTDTVKIELSSGGGLAYDALAFYDRIRNSPLNIEIVGIGYIASAAVLVLAAGDDRKLTVSSWVMVHEDTASGLKGMKIWEMEKALKHYRRLEDQWCELLENSTYTDRKTWAKLHKEETFLTAKECLALGLVEEII